MNTATIASIGIDLGKTTFHLVALDCHAGVMIRKKFSRSQLLAYTANLPWSLIGMEACSGAHFLAAKLRDQGHEVKLIPAQFVKPYRKSNKNDFIDAEAIAEAVTRQNMRFVPIKTDDQLDLQALHRVRDRLVRRRTALINQIRGFLLERGLVFAQRPANLRRPLLPANDCAPSPALAHSSPPRWWPPSAMVRPSATGASLPPGSGWLRGSIPREEGRDCSASANAATLTCDACSFTVRGQCSGAPSTTPAHCANGATSCCCEWRKMSPPWRWPTNWHASPGLYSAAASLIARESPPWQLETQRWKRTLRLENAVRFPLSHRSTATTTKVPIQRLQEEQRDEATVKRRAGKPDVGNVEKTVGFIRTGTRGLSLCARSTSSI